MVCEDESESSLPGERERHVVGAIPDPDPYLTTRSKTKATASDVVNKRVSVWCAASERGQNTRCGNRKERKRAMQTGTQLAR